MPTSTRLARMNTGDLDTLRGHLQCTLGAMNYGRQPNALMATFQLACLELIAGRHSRRVDEETFTGALLGAFAATAPWCAALFNHFGTPGCAWKRFRKNGGRPDDEPLVGADFGLVIRLCGGYSRVALFQAKRPESERPRGVSVHHLSPVAEGQAHRAQFMRLMNFSKLAMQYAGFVAKPGVASLTWVHYLAYLPDELPCFPMSQLQDIADHYTRSPTDKAPSLALKTRQSHELTWLLSRGAGDSHPADSYCSGWLTLEDDEATRLLNVILPHMDIYEATNDTTAPVLDLKYADDEMGNAFEMIDTARANRISPLISLRKKTGGDVGVAPQRRSAGSLKDDEPEPTLDPDRPNPRDGRSPGCA